MPIHEVLKKMAFVFLLVAGGGFSCTLCAQTGIHLNKIQTGVRGPALPDFLDFRIHFSSPFSENIAPAGDLHALFFADKTIPADFAFRHFAPFCKVEIKIEKALQKSVKFRLGTLDYVNTLEYGKRY